MKTFNNHFDGTKYQAMTLEDWLLFLNDNPRVIIYDRLFDRKVWEGDTEAIIDSTFMGDITEFTIDFEKTGNSLEVIVNVNLEGNGIR